MSRPEFGGEYGVVATPDIARLLAAVVVHYQNEQGEPGGIDLLIAGKATDCSIVVDNGLMKPLFEGESEISAVYETPMEHGSLHFTVVFQSASTSSM